MPAALADVLAEFAAGIIILWILLSLLTCRGLLAMWTRTFGAMLVWLHDHMQLRVSVYVKTITIDFGWVFGEVNAKVVGWFQAWQDGLEKELAFFLSSAEKLIEWQAGMIEGLAADTLGLGERLLHVKLPKWAKWIAAGAVPAWLVTKILRYVLAHVHAIVHTVTRVIVHDIPHTAAQIAHKATSIALPHPGAIAHVEHEIYGLTKRNLRLSKRLHRVEALFGAAAMAAVMANALGLGSNWRCITRGNIGRAARHWCGLDKWLVDFLLLGSVEAFAVTDICDFSWLLREAAKAQRPALLELVSVENALVSCHDAQPLLKFNLPDAIPTPLQGISPLAA